MRRSSLLVLLAPSALVMVAAMAPLIAGQRTLFLRDVLNTHLTMKAGQAQLLAQGEPLEVDLYRGGGQPLLGNPNGLPFYPTNILYRWAEPLWALNAHFWLHWLLAPLAMAFLARAWGLSTAGAAAAGVAYGLSGFLLSHFLFYNLMAGAVLAPVLVASSLGLARRRRPLVPALGVTASGALLLVAGDPTMAAVVGFAAVTAFALAARRPWGPRLAILALALVAGVLLAAPQWVELLRILEVSFRGAHGFQGEGATFSSWEPVQALEWLIPFFFGLPDRVGPGGFWGHAFFGEALPFFPTLYPGLGVLLLVAAAGRPRFRAMWWAWTMILLGLVLSLGGHNPAVTAFLRGPGAGLLRFPVKLWILVALGGALVAGFGWERLLRRRHEVRRQVVVLSLTMAGAFVALAAFLASGLPILARLLPPSYPTVWADGEMARWGVLALASAGLAVSFAFLVATLGRWPRLSPALFLLFHTISQLVLLKPVWAWDESQAYREKSALLAAAPELLRGGSVVHGAVGRLFGPSDALNSHSPDGQARWMARRAARELYPFVGVQEGLRYELNLSPEGLDTVWSRLATEGLRVSSDDERIRLLKAWGVGSLLLNRGLSPAALPLVQQVAELAEGEHRCFLYAIKEPAPAIRVVGNRVWAPSPVAALSLLRSPALDPRETVVLAGPERREPGLKGRIRGLEKGPGEIRFQVETESSGVVVVERAFVPLYRVTVDGRRVSPLPVNLYRLGIPVESGRHEVVVRVNERPGRLARGVAALGLLLLGALLWSMRAGMIRVS